jgi:hypothetical protein
LRDVGWCSGEGANVAADGGLRVRARTLHKALLVSVSYLLLALVATYPVWLNMSETVIGPEEDNQQNCWTIWWYQKALFEDHISPWHSHLLFYPFGASLGLHDVGPAYAIPGALLAEVIGAIAAYNTLILLAFVAAGLAAFLLAYDMGFRWPAAWTAGVVFAFSPFLSVHAQHHLQLTGIHWFPLLSLALRRTRAGSRWQWPVLAGLFFAMIGLSSLYFAVFALLLALGFMVWNSYVDRQVLSKLLPRLLVFGLVAAVLLVPRALLALDAIEEGGEYLLYGASDYCSDLVGLILPPSSHPIWGTVFESAQQTTTGSSWEFEYLGVVALLCAAFSLVSPNRSSMARWLLLASGAVVLSFGPLLHVSGKVVVGRPLPYYWLIQKTPILNGIRVPVRFTLLALLGLSVTAAGGVEEIARRLGKRRIALLAGILVFFDFLQAPLSTTPSPEAPAHEAILAEVGSCALYDIPSDDYATRLKAQYLQMEHTCPTVTGVLGRDPGHAFALLDSTPTLRSVLASNTQPPPGGIAEDAAHQELLLLSRIGIGGIVLHRYALDAATLEMKLLHLHSLLGSPVYIDSLYVGWALPMSQSERVGLGF